MSDVEAELEMLHAKVQRLTTIVDDLVDHLANTRPPGPAGWGITPVFSNVVDWVTGRLIPLLERQPGGPVRWCASWWAHPEVVSRLEACWRAWETLRLDPATGMSVWYRDHLDPALSAVLSPSGPFAACTPERHSPHVPLFVAALPT